MDVKCSVCDAKIPKERLKAVPGTEFCVKCAEKHGPEWTIDVDSIVAQPSTDDDPDFDDD